MSSTPQSMTDILTPASSEEARLKKQRAYAVLGTLMGTQPTQQVGEMLAKDATNARDLNAEIAAKAADLARRAQERTQDSAQWQKQFDENKRQFAQQEARLSREPSTADWDLKQDDLGNWYKINKRSGAVDRVQFPGSEDGARPKFNPAGGKPTPQQQNDLTAINKQRGAIEGGIDAIKRAPKGTFGLNVPGALEQFGGDVGAFGAQTLRTPDQTASRAFIFNNVSAIMKERAGTAQSASERAVIERFTPKPTDTSEEMTGKFNAYLDYLDTQEAALRGFTPEELGMAPRTGAGPRKPEYGGTPPASDGEERWERTPDGALRRAK